MPTQTHVGRVMSVIRDQSNHLVLFVLDNRIWYQITYRDAAQLGFWIKKGQLLEVTGAQQTDRVHVTEVCLLQNCRRKPPGRRFLEIFGLR